MADQWNLAARARNDFADMIDTLSDEQVEQGTTLCENWSPHLVLAHAVTFVDLPLPKFMFNVVKARGNFDAASDVMARKIAQRPVSDLTATLRAKAGKKSSLPTFPEGLTVADMVVHQQDVRRGLGLDGAPDPELVEYSLEFLTTHKQAKLLLEKKGLLDGLRLEATDLDWSSGSGDLVSGPGEAILMTMVRRDASSELTGDGVDTLVARAAAD
jgi:uncharacterized protein (TIGR03083 family)